MTAPFEDFGPRTGTADDSCPALIEEAYARQSGACSEAKEEVYDLGRVGREVGGWQEEQYKDKLGVKRITVSSQRVTFELDEPASMHGMDFAQTFSYDIYGRPGDIAIAEIKGVRYDGQPVTKIEIKSDKAIFYGPDGEIDRLTGRRAADALNGFFAPQKFREDLLRLYWPKQANALPDGFPKGNEILWS
ncbi:MAG TPA: hypothetical protein V6D08_15805 [Candidatus Obscuribacterales bacterium]